MGHAHDTARGCSYMEYQQMNLNMTGLIMGFNGADKVHSVPIPFPYAQVRPRSAILVTLAFGPDSRMLPPCSAARRSPPPPRRWRWGG